MMPTTTAPGGQVGRSVPRLEAVAKVTGRAEYVHHMRLPGMLMGKIVRSTVAHGRLKSIDLGGALKVPGVHRIVTRDDIVKVVPHPYYGSAGGEFSFKNFYDSRNLISSPPILPSCPVSPYNRPSTFRRF